MSRQQEGQGTEDRIVGILLGVAVLFSIVSNIIQVPIQWQIPVIFLALFAIFKLVFPIRELVHQVKSLSSNQSLIQFKHYPSNMTFIMRCIKSLGIRSTGFQ